MSKSLVILAGILLAIVPWMYGGSSPLSILIAVFGLLIATFLLQRQGEVSNSASILLRGVTTIWLAWGVLSLTWSVNRFQTEQWLLFALIAIIVFTLTARLSEVQKERLIKGYLAVAAIVAIYGIYLYLTGPYERLTSSFFWANPCAAYLLPAAIITGWRWAARQSWINGLLILLIGTAFWLTDSRAAILALVVTAVLALAARPVRKKAGWLLLAAFITFVTSLGMAMVRSEVTDQTTMTPGSRFSEAASGESMSGNDRLNYLKSSFEIWKDNPLTGTGAGTFSTVHPQYQESVVSAASNPHNLAAKALAEQGLIGLLLLMYLALIVMWGIRRGVHRDPSMAPIALAAFALALHFGVEMNDRYPALIALLAMLTGLVYKPWLVLPLRGRARTTLPLLVLVATIMAISWYMSDAAFEKGRAYDANRDLITASENYAEAHTGLMYDPDSITSEAIDYYSIAGLTGGSKTYVEKATDLANEAIAKDPQDSQHYFLMGRIERLAGNPDRAEQWYKRALQKDRLNHPEYYVDLASLLIEKKDEDGANKVIDSGLKLYPDAVVANRFQDSDVEPSVRRLRLLKKELAK